MGKITDLYKLSLYQFSSNLLLTFLCVYVKSVAEAQYASKRQVPIIPLKYEKGFKESGWLGLLIGSLLYYQVDTDMALMNSLPKIKDALKKHIKLADDSLAKGRLANSILSHFNIINQCRIY